MPQEIERKFLLKNSNWRNLIKDGFQIKQGYLNSIAERTVRVRLKGDKGFLTIKGKNIGMTRAEFEYEIPFEDAKEILQLYDTTVIEKTRYEVIFQNKTWEIDEFEGLNKGLFLAEIELEDENEKITIPEWIGEEVTGNPKYYNSSLSKKPFSEW